jgi:hypothetical protein
MPTLPADLRLYYLQRPPPKIYESTNIQTYFPSLETLFPSIAEQSAGSPTLAARELALDVSERVSVVEDLHTKIRRVVPTWIRKMHLVEPIEVVSGDYVIPNDGALPTFRAPWQRGLRKLNDPYNEAYTDAVFACMASRLVETGRSPHFCRFFGTYNGRVPEYSYNATDDMSDIEGEPWYGEGLKSGAFRMIAVDPYDPDVTAEVTRPWEDMRPRLFGSDGSDGETVTSEESSTSSSSSTSHSSESSTPSVTSLDALEIQEIQETRDIQEPAEQTEPKTEITETAAAAQENETDELVEADIEFSGVATIVRPPIRLSRVSNGGAEAGDTEDTDEEDDEDEIDYKMIIKNFPVQMTVLERCDGTLDDLMEDEIADDASSDMRETKEQRWTAWIFQVIAGLTTAQQHYDFVHNDLHTNNVMWCGTGETHLYYQVTGSAGGDRYYRVPTYGRIMKIIDFGRATFKPPMASSKKGSPNRLWISDAYAPNADAGGQYNCGPYYDKDKPKVAPNKSFDLCRLAVAMLETLWAEPVEPVSPRSILTREPGRVQAETTSPLWNLMWLWLTDKTGRNILKNPDGTERYPQFDLYCAIAKDAQNAVPAQQLTLPLFDSAFRCRRKDIPTDAPLFKLQASHRS